ncbi:MAG: HigA family addiction module antitoxin [Oceanipulchritudo sp.]
MEQHLREYGSIVKLGDRKFSCRSTTDQTPAGVPQKGSIWPKAGFISAARKSFIDAKRKQCERSWVIKGFADAETEKIWNQQRSRRLPGGIPHSRVTAIIKGQRAVTPDTALRLARYFGTSAEFWLGLQKEYDLRKAREELGATIDREVAPLSLAS